MKQHKWHKEIKAWADGAEVQESILVEKKHGQFDWCEWKVTTNPTWETVEHRYRIKPQPKEPQYLYVYKGAISHEPIITFGKSNDPLVETNFVAKIKIEVDDNGND
jgi:hypothetical protein